MSTVHINIFGSFFSISGQSDLIIKRISLDFSYFLTNTGKSRSFRVQIFIESPPWEVIPEITASRQTDTSIIYERNNIRYNDYHGEALTIVDDISREAKIYCPELNMAHELGYLFILSKSGKEMDLKGFHKLHAMGLQWQESNLLLISSSKGGKSTHFLKILENAEYKIFSDDTPVVDRLGRLYPFPLRIGIEKGATLPVFVDKGKTYNLVRKKYGPKTLIPLSGLDRKIATYRNGQRTLVVVGVRSRKEKPLLKRVSWLVVLPYLIKYMVVGLGLPMVLEYFFESGLKDLLKRIKIILNRTISSISLLIRSETYIMDMSSDFEKNSACLSELIEKK